MRKSIEETWRYLEARGETMPRDPSGRPIVPPAMPSCDDEEPGFSFFRTRAEDADLGEDDADLRHGGVGQRALDVGLRQPAQESIQGSRQPDHRHHRGDVAGFDRLLAAGDGLGFAGGAEVVHAFDQAAAEQVVPDAVGHDAGRQRVVR